MMPREQAQPWISNAEGDFEMLEVAMSAGLKRWNHICFHASKASRNT